MLGELIEGGPNTKKVTGEILKTESVQIYKYKIIVSIHTKTVMKFDYKGKFLEKFF